VNVIILFIYWGCEEHTLKRFDERLFGALRTHKRGLGSACNQLPLADFADFGDPMASPNGLGPVLQPNTVGLPAVTASMACHDDIVTRFQPEVKQ